MPDELERRVSSVRRAYERRFALLVCVLTLTSCGRRAARQEGASSNIRVGASMAHLSGGRFRMGSDSVDIARLLAAYPGLPRELFLQETPAHEVRLQPFDLDRTEVTVTAFASFVRDYPAWRRSAEPANDSNGRYLSTWDGGVPPAGIDSLPVTFVTWYAATAYCASVAKRLPTEAEWEFAALGGQHGDVFPWGAASPTPSDANWLASELHAPVAVAHYPANAYGLYDMAGNVWEYVSDRWRDRYSDPTPAITISPRAILARDSASLEAESGRHVIRGGSYDGGVVNLRARYRDSHPAQGARAFVGFRCARG